MSWLTEALNSARGSGCPKCLVGRFDLMADPGFACDVCHGTGIEHWQRLSATEDLLAALKGVEAHHVQLNKDSGRDESRSATLAMVRAAIAKAEGQP